MAEHVRRLRRAADRFVRPAGTVGRGEHRRVPRRTVAVAAGVAVLLVAGGGAYALTRPGTDRYTTATAQTGTVTQTVAGPGTVASVSSAAVAFQVSGTVATVDVAPGDQVDAGQTLATLDPTLLEAAVTSAQETLEEARQQRADDLSAQTSGSGSSSGTGSSGAGSSGTASSGTGSSGTGSSGTGSSGTGTSGTGSSSAASGPTSQGSTGTSASGTSAEVRAAVDDVTAAQEALLSTYAAAATAQAASSAALAALSTSSSTAWCAELAALDPTQVTADSTTDPAEQSGTALSTVQGWVASCQAALTELGGLQTATDAAQLALSSAMTTLDAKVATLQQLVAASGTPDGTATSDSGGSGSTSTGLSDQTASASSTPTGTTGLSGTSSGASTPSGTSGAVNGQSSVPTAADLVADQAAIDAAEAQVAVATADLQFATITAPLSGTVAAVDLAVGDQVSAASTTATITVIGAAGFQVSLTVDLGSVDVVQVGQPATVTAPSTDQTLDGTVTSIGVLNVSSTSTPQYTVTILLDTTGAPLYDGSSAQATITVAGASDVLTVPTSAVHVDGSTASVDVLADGAVSSTEVERGAVGAELTEIRDGLSAGDTVVLADRTEPLQAETTSRSSSNGQMMPGDFSGGPPSSMQRPGG